MKKVIKASKFGVFDLTKLIETLNGLVYKIKTEGYISEETDALDPDDLQYAKGRARNIKELADSISSVCSRIMNYR